MRYLKYLKGAAACTAIAGGLALFCFCASAEEAGLSAEEFAKVCEENHAYESRYFLPPFKDPQEEAEVLNYAYHYREVVMLPDGSFADNPYDTGWEQCLTAGDIWMDVEDGCEISYEYHIIEQGDEWENREIVEGGTITPYYRAVSSSAEPAEGKQYVYVPNEPAEVPVIFDLPQNYDWKRHGDKTLDVSAEVTVRSAKDGRERTFTSNICHVTNLYKDEPDCYKLRPTDLEGYTIQAGDTLGKIAERYFGNRGDWIYIFERNKERISNADLLRPGQHIVIPNAESYR